MPWQMADPLAAAAAAAGGVFKGQDDAKQRAIEAARQAQIDKQTAAYQAAQTAYQQSQMKHTQFEEGRETAGDTAEAKAEGQGLKPPAPPKNNGKPLSSRQWADYYAQLGSFYAQNGASEGANKYLGMADKFGTLADRDESAQLAIRKQMNVEAETQAKIHHWTAAEKQAAKNEIDRTIIASNHDAASLHASAMRASATIAAANTSADARLRATRMDVEGSMERTKYVQGEEDARQSKALKAKSSSTGIKITKFRNIPSLTQTLMAKEANDVIAKGAPRDAVLKRMAQTHGISVDEARGILDDNSSGDDE